MSRLTLWQRIRDWFGFYVPSEVSENMPRTLAEHRARREAVEEHRRLVQHWNAIEHMRAQNDARQRGRAS